MKWKQYQCTCTLLVYCWGREAIRKWAGGVGVRVRTRAVDGKAQEIRTHLFTIILNVFLIISTVICRTYLLDHTSVQSTHSDWNFNPCTRLWPLYSSRWFFPGRVIGRTVPSTKPKQLLSSAPLLKTASAYFSRETTRWQIPRTPLRRRERRQRRIWTARHTF